MVRKEFFSTAHGCTTVPDFHWIHLQFRAMNFSELPLTGERTAFINISRGQFCVKNSGAEKGM